MPEHVDEPVVVGDGAGLEELAALIGAGSTDGIPVLCREHDGLVVIVTGCQIAIWARFFATVGKKRTQNAK